MDEALHPQSGLPPCLRYGLDIRNLQDEALLKMKTYRRLYNIVAHDKTQSKYQFRPHLIKELYFLLHVTPFIEQRLRERFLDQIEEWYNCHDHKKINLNKNLSDLIGTVKEIAGKKKKFNESRPKSGVQWDTSLNPFFRPYTAKMKMKRPNSKSSCSKFGLNSTAGRTTKFESSLQPNHTDFDEEWERSSDYIKKFRTVHPQQEPTYQKLLNLMQRANQKQFIEDDATQSLDQFTFSKFRRPKTGFQKGRATQLPKNDPQLENGCLNPRDYEKQNEFCIDEQESDEENMEDEPVAADQKKIYCRDSLEKQHSGLRERLLGMKVLKELPENEEHPFHRLYQNNQLENHRQMIGSKDRNEYLKQHLEYTKKKTFFKRQQMRKTQSKHLYARRKKEQKSSEEQKPSEEHQVLDSRKFKTIHLGSGEKGLPKPVYDEKEFFAPKSQPILRRYYNFKKKPQPNQQVPLRGLSGHKRFLSEKKFNPGDPQNIENYNSQALEEIEKIKENLGGKNYISTDALMKGLHIEGSMEDEKGEWRNYDKKYMMQRRGTEKKKKKKSRKLKRGRG